MKKIALLSITASHYRSRVYSLMDNQFDCSFYFGVDNTSVKRMDTSILKDTFDLRNMYIWGSKWYIQPGLLNKLRKYDIIINDLGIYCLQTWALLILCFLSGKKIYHWDHGWYGKEGLAKKILKRIYFGMATGSFIYGDYAIRLMKENGFNGSKLYPIHNSLDYDKQLELRNCIKESGIFKDKFCNSNPTLIMIGRLNMRKQLGLLIEAVRQLKDKDRHYNVVLVGDGEDRQAIQGRVSELGLSDMVWFYGACYDEKTNAELLYNSDLCVVPGDIGLTAIHAMMFGVPVISHDYFPDQGPEFEVVKEGITGSFFKHNNVESLADTIDNWFIHHFTDRDLVREKCYHEIDNFWTPQYQMNILKGVIDDAEL